MGAAGPVFGCCRVCRCGGRRCRAPHRVGTSVFANAPSALRAPAERHKAITDTRTGLIALTAALGAGGGLAYTARTYRLSREGHITDGYTKAVDQLGETEKLAVRLGGIYALERLAVDSERDHHIVVKVLGAFVREHDPPKPGNSPPTDPPNLHVLPDVEAAVTVLARLPLRRGIGRA